MLKKYIGISLITASIAVAGCSSSDDDDTGALVPEVPEVEAPEGEVPEVEVPEGEAPEVGGPAVVDGTIVVPQDFTPADDATLNLAETLTNGIGDNTFTTLVTAAGDAGLVDALGGPGPLTVFAPTDAAFAALGAENIPTDAAALATVLQGHIVAGALDSGTVVANPGANVTDLNGGSIAITTNADGAILVGGAGILTADIQTTNGIIHVIDTVIVGSGGDEGEGEEETPVAVDPNATAVTEPSLIALNEAGFTEYVTLHTNAALGGVFDENQWTAFIPSNDAIPDDVDQAAAFQVVNNHLLTNGAFTAAQLLADNPPTANGGAALTFGGTADALTVNGFTATPIVIEGISAILFAIDGVITP